MDGQLLSQSGSTYSAGGNINNIVVYHGDVNQEGNEKRKVIDWFSSMASVNHYAIHSEMFAKLTPGTVNWILREPTFNKWLSKEHGTFWGVGIPGAGKTVLTSFVIDYLQKRGYGELVIFAYCRYDDTLAVDKILARLLGQLAEKSAAAFAFVLEEVYNPAMEKRVNPTTNELIDALEHAIRLCETRVFVVIDALDELRDDIREGLVDVLFSLERSVFITSRSISIGSLEEPDLHIHARAEDLSNFVTAEVRRLPKLWRLLKDRKDVLEELIEEITIKSDGMFLLAALQLAAVGGITNVKSLRKVVSTLPTKLNDMYEFNVRRIMDQSEEESTLAIRAILWITHACRPLKIGELLEAVVVEPESTELDPDEQTDPKTLVSVCCGLLAVESEMSAVRLIHYTTHDFFASCKHGIFEQPQIYLTTTCVMYLKLSGVCRTRPLDFATVATFQRTRSLEFVEYVCRYTGYHTFCCFRDSNTLPDSTLQILSGSQFIPLVPHPDISSALAFSPDSIHYGRLIHLSAIFGIPSLVQASSRFSEEESFNKLTPLFYAAASGKDEIVRLLLDEYSVDVNAQGPHLETALHIAAEQGHHTVVELLLGSPAIMVNTPDLDENTALHYASRYGYEEVVRLLLKAYRIDIKGQNKLGYTALHLAASNGHDGIVEILLERYGVYVNVPNNRKDTALHSAVMGSRTRVVELLLRSPKIDVNVKNFQQETPLAIALQKYSSDTAIRLLLSRPDIDAISRDRVGNTPLHHALKSGRTEIAQVLIGFPKANVNAGDLFGWTPLHFAVLQGYTDVVQTLLDHPGLDINAMIIQDPKDSDHDIPTETTALDLCLRGRHKHLASLLKDRGAKCGQELASEKA